MGYQTAPKGSLSLPCGLYLKAQHCCLSSNGWFSLPSAPHLPPAHPLHTQYGLLQELNNLSEKLVLAAYIQAACK